MTKVNKGAIRKVIRDARYYFNMGIEVKSFTARIQNHRIEYSLFTGQTEPVTEGALDLTGIINEYLYKNTLNLAKATTKAYEMIEDYVLNKEGMGC